MWKMRKTPKLLKTSKIGILWWQAKDDNGDRLESNETRFFFRFLSPHGIPRCHPSGISHVKLGNQ